MLRTLAGQMPFVGTKCSGYTNHISDFDTTTTQGVYVFADIDKNIYGVGLVFVAEPHFIIQLLFSGNKCKFRRGDYNSTLENEDWIELN